MTIDVISQGASRDYTIGVRHQTFVVSNNSGQYGLVSNYRVEGILQPNENIGPQPGRVSLGPFLIGDSFRVTCDIGQLLVEYDNLVSGGDVGRSEFDSLAGTVSSHGSAISSLQSSQTAQDVTISGLSTTVGTLSTTVGTLSTEVSDLGTEVAGLSSDVTIVEGDVTTLTTIVEGIDDTISGATGDGVFDNGPTFNAALGLTGSFVTDNKVVARLPNGGVYYTSELIDCHPSVSLNFKSRGGIIILPDGDMSSANADNAEAALLRIPRRTPSSLATVAWGFSLSGANLDARGVTFASAAFTVDAATDIFTSTAHGRPNGYGLWLSGSPLPSGLSESVLYIVTNATTDTFQLTTQDGTLVDVLANGSGTWYTKIHGIRVPNADPANNDLDPDPSFAGNKDYVAGRYEFGDVIGFPGTGGLFESTNGRLDLHSFRFLNNGEDGAAMTGNDITVTGHSAAGGNGDFGFKVGDASGFFMTTANVWSQPTNRSPTTGAVWVNQRKLFGIGISEFNDWIRLDGGDSFWRGGVMTANCYAPYNEIFSADGVARDGSTGDLRLQAFNGITDYQSVDFIGNKYFRTTATNKVTQPSPGPFASWMNIGGDLAGRLGTAPRWFIDASSNAYVNTIDQSTTAPNVKPWTGPQAVISAVTVAAPGVFTSVAHGLTTDQQVALNSTGSVPGGLFAGVTYFPIVIDADTFQLANIPGQTTGLTTTSAGSGTISFGVLDSIPYNARGGAQINYLIQNSFNGETRIGAKGQAHSKLLLGIADDTYGLRKGASVNFATADVDTVNNKITSAAHGLKDNYPVKFTTTTTLPGGLSSTQQYWVVSSTTNDFKVAETPGGTVVDITSVGAGTHTFHSWERVYAIEMGDKSLPSGISYRHAAYGQWEFGKAVQYLDTAFDGRVLTNGATRTIQGGHAVQRLSVAGGGIAGATINWPTDLNASQFIHLFVTGGPISAITWGVSGSGAINANAAALPASTSGFLGVLAWYERDTNNVYPLHVVQPSVSDISAKIGSGAAVTLASNTITNLTSIVLTPGLWNVTGNVIFTSAAATTIPTIVSAALSTSATTIPATDATAYGKRLTPHTVAIASGTDYDTMNLGVNRVSVAAGTTTTIYLNGRTTYTGAGASATAFGALRAVPAQG